MATAGTFDSGTPHRLEGPRSFSALMFVERDLPLSPRGRFATILIVTLLQMLLLYILGTSDPFVDAPAVHTFQKGQWVMPEHYPEVASVPRDTTDITTPCYFQRSGMGCVARFDVNVDPAVSSRATEPLALLMPYSRGEVTFRLNGSLLYDSRWSVSPQAIFQPPPIFVPLPTGLLRSADNVIQVELQAATYFGDAVGPFQVGPAALLQARYHRLEVFADALPQAMDAACGFAGLLLVITAMFAPRVRRLWLIGAVLAVAAQPGLARLLQGEAADAFFIFSNHMLFELGPIVWAISWVWRNPEKPLPLVRRFAFVVPVLAWLLWFIVPADQRLLYCGILPLIILFPTGILAVIEGVNAYRQSPSDSGFFLWNAMFFSVVATGRDAWWLIIENQLLTFSMLRYGVVFTALALFSLIVWQFVAQINAQKKESTMLQAAIEQATEEVRQSQSQEQNVFEKMLLEAERSRLMTDLHDGLLGQLTSIRQLCATDSAMMPEAAALASQRALIDLRLVVASMEDSAGELALALGAVRETVEPFVSTAGIRLHWYVRDLVNVKNLNPANALQVTRLVAEMIDHAVECPGTTEITLNAETADDAGHWIAVSIRTDGSGCGRDLLSGERGASVRRIVAGLGGELRHQSEPTGESAKVLIPTTLPVSNGFAAT